MTVNEIREELVKRGICTKEEAENIKGKSNLLNLLESRIDITELDEVEQKAQTRKNNQPKPGTKEWTEYILSHCTKDELQQGHPTCDGLRRLTEEFIGEIISQRVLSADTKVVENYGLISTVVYEVKVLPLVELSNRYFDINNIPYKTYVEAADCWLGNTPKIFAVHPSATAATRAEGRCLRKALKLTVLTAEEMNNDKNAEEIIQTLVGRSEEEDQLITSTQKVLIQTRAEQLNINVNKLVEHTFGQNDINLLSRSEAGQLIKLINEYQTHSKEIPTDILI